MYNLKVMVGIPKSGKSTFVNEIYPNYQIICADDIRLAMGVQFEPKLEQLVWSIHAISLEAAMIRGRDVIIDSTNTTIESILKAKKLAKMYNYSFECIVICTDRDECLSRNNRDKSKGKPYVPPEIIKRMDIQLDRLLNDKRMEEIEKSIHVS